MKFRRESKVLRVENCRESKDGELKPARVAGDCAVVQVDCSRCRTHTAGGLEPNRIEVYQIQIQLFNYSIQAASSILDPV